MRPRPILRPHLRPRPRPQASGHAEPSTCLSTTPSWLDSMAGLSPSLTPLGSSPAPCFPIRRFCLVATGLSTTEAALARQHHPLPLGNSPASVGLAIAGVFSAPPRSPVYSRGWLATGLSCSTCRSQGLARLVLNQLENGAGIAEAFGAAACLTAPSWDRTQPKHLVLGPLSWLRRSGPSRLAACPDPRIDSIALDMLLLPGPSL